MYENLQAVTTMEAPAALGAYSQGRQGERIRVRLRPARHRPGHRRARRRHRGEQAARALKNITNILAAAGCGVEHVCRATIYLRNVEDFSEVDGVYAKTFTGTVKPARVAFGNNMIPKGGARRDRRHSGLPAELTPHSPRRRRTAAHAVSHSARLGL